MNRTRIFVSSTCYDLGQLRENLRDTINQLGHKPLLSEYSSFPIYPELGAVENCKKNVSDNTDIFILIVGGRRGSLDTETGKPVTNIEYNTAKQNGIEAFIFVQKDVMNLLPVWEKNQDADFTPKVDYPEVFSFIKQLKADQKWIFAFDKSSEIIEIMKIQLSVLLRELICRRKEGKLLVPKEFIGESERVKKIVIDKPQNWEFLLTEELLRERLKTVNDRIDRINRGLIFHKSNPVNGRDCKKFLRSKVADIINLIKILMNAIPEELPQAWGKPGQPGDAVSIKSAIDSIIIACNELCQWEIEMRSVDPPDVFQEIIRLMHGWTYQIISEINRIPNEIAKPFREPNPEGTYNIHLEFRAPMGIQELGDKLEALSNNPDLLHYWE